MSEGAGRLHQDPTIYCNGCRRFKDSCLCHSQTIGPTPEAIKSLHGHLIAMIRNARASRDGVTGIGVPLLEEIRAALPSLPPEESTPMISSVEKLAQRVWNLTAPGESFGENCIRARDAEIIAVSQWNMKICTIFGSLPCPRCETLRDLIRALRNANDTASKGMTA